MHGYFIPFPQSPLFFVIVCARMRFLGRGATSADGMEWDYKGAGRKGGDFDDRKKGSGLGPKKRPLPERYTQKDGAALPPEREERVICQPRPLFSLDPSGRKGWKIGLFYWGPSSPFYPLPLPSSSPTRLFCCCCPQGGGREWRRSEKSFVAGEGGGRKRAPKWK